MCHGLFQVSVLLLALLSVASPWHPWGLCLLIFTVQVKVCLAEHPFCQAVFTASSVLCLKSNSASAPAPPVTTEVSTTSLHRIQADLGPFPASLLSPESTQLCFVFLLHVRLHYERSVPEDRPGLAKCDFTAVVHTCPALVLLSHRLSFIP